MNIRLVCGRGRNPTLCTLRPGRRAPAETRRSSLPEAECIGTSLCRRDGWLDGRPLDNPTAAYVAEAPRHRARRHSSTRCAGFSRWVRRSRAPPSRSGLLTPAPRPAGLTAGFAGRRRRDRPRGPQRLDAVIAGLLFMAGMRRSELNWSEVTWSPCFDTVADRLGDDFSLVAGCCATTSVSNMWSGVARAVAVSALGDRIDSGRLAVP